MNGSHQKQVDEILTAIDHGKLSRNDTERRLQDLIDREIYKQTGPADLRLLDSCYQLLGLMYGVQLQHMDFSKSVGRVMYQYRRLCRLHELRKQAGRIVAILVILLCISLMPTIRWITTENSDDHELFVVRGHHVDLQTVAYCISQHHEFDSIESSDWNDIISFLGCEPHIAYPKDWQVMNYICYIYPENISLYIHAILPDGKDVVFSIKSYANIDDIELMVEQSESRQIIDRFGNLLYVIKNLDSHIYVWLMDNSLYSIYGNIPLIDVENIIRQNGGN